MLDHFTDLDDELAVGCYPNCPEHMDFLHDECGVRGLVNLQSDADLGRLGLRWPILWQLYTRKGILTTRVPVPDLDRSALSTHLDTAVQAVASHIQAGRKTYVHCNAGINRSPSTIIGYLVAHRAFTVVEATGWLGERHRCVPYPDVLAAWAKRRGLPQG